MTEDKHRILIVDDELHVVRALQRTLGDTYDVDYALGGKEGLDALAAIGPYAVVVSDMRMPEMDGADFLTHVKEKYPETVRVMLTGYANLESASRAINEGAIYRFATKPCAPDDFRALIKLAVEQHELLALEKALLADTLRGTIEVLSQVLELVNPVAFGRASRIRRIVNHMVDQMHLPHDWMYDTAALLSQLGCVTLPQTLLERLYANSQMTEEEQALYKEHPGIGSNLLSRIPRLEIVSEMISNQLDVLENPVPDGGRKQGLLGAEILHIADEYDRLISSGMGHGAAKQVIGSRIRFMSPGVYDALLSIKPPNKEETVLSITLKELVPGMVFLDDVREARGALLLAAGHVATAASVCRLKEMATSHMDVIQPFRVRRGG